jgi:hypothetical protein
MDFAIGQIVTMRSGPYSQQGTVEEINEDSVLVYIPPTGAAGMQRPGWLPKREVQQLPTVGETHPYSRAGTAIYFRYDGTQGDSILAGGLIEPRPAYTEYGPWRLVELENQ